MLLYHVYAHDKSSMMIRVLSGVIFHIPYMSNNNDNNNSRKFFLRHVLSDISRLGTYIVYFMCSNERIVKCRRTGGPLFVMLRQHWPNEQFLCSAPQ